MTLAQPVHTTHSACIRSYTIRILTSTAFWYHCLSIQWLWLYSLIGDVHIDTHTLCTTHENSCLGFLRSHFDCFFLFLFLLPSLSSCILDVTIFPKLFNMKVRLILRLRWFNTKCLKLTIAVAVALFQLLQFIYYLNAVNLNGTFSFSCRINLKIHYV